MIFMTTFVAAPRQQLKKKNQPNYVSLVTAAYRTATCYCNELAKHHQTKKTRALMTLVSLVLT